MGEYTRVTQCTLLDGCCLPFEEFLHEKSRPFISCNHAEKWAKKVYEEINFIFRSRYNSWQYHLPLYFVPILQMQLKDPLVFSQLDTSPQLCNPSLHSLMSTWMNQKEMSKKGCLKALVSKEVVLNLT